MIHALFHSSAKNKIHTEAQVMNTGNSACKIKYFDCCVNGHCEVGDMYWQLKCLSYQALEPEFGPPVTGQLGMLAVCNSSLGKQKWHHQSKMGSKNSHNSETRVWLKDASSTNVQWKMISNINLRPPHAHGNTQAKRCINTCTPHHRQTERHTHMRTHTLLKATIYNISLSWHFITFVHGSLGCLKPSCVVPITHLHFNELTLPTSIYHKNLTMCHGFLKQYTKLSYIKK